MKHFYKGLIFFLSFSSGQSNAQCNFTTAVPYYESFAGILYDNQLPTCWIASNPSVTCHTYSLAQPGRFARTGQEFAAFVASPANGASYFFTNGILLNAGSTYSASMWYMTEFYGYNNWQDLSILIGTTQTSSGQTLVATTGGPAISSVYKSLSGTFSVSVTGIYYAAIRGTNTNNCCAEYLTFDDFLIEQSCNVSMGVVASATTICAGRPITFTATGVDTYTWSNGSTGPVATYTPVSGNTISVTGTETLSGCQAVKIISLPVNPSPNVTLLNPPKSICLGESVTLYAFGANAYTWGPTQYSSSVIVVTPTITTTYTLFGSNIYGCYSGAQIFQIVVLPLPAVTVTSSAVSNTACSGETIVLTGIGASTFTWLSNAGILVNNPVTINLNATTVFTIEAEDVNGCRGTNTYEITIDECLGLSNLSVGSNPLLIYPNPFNKEFIVEYKSGKLKTIDVIDITGRTLSSLQTFDDSIPVKLDNLMIGIYFISVKSEKGRTLVKIVKQ